ncbi:MAG: hypothetical protein L3J96_03855, partial [Thermoplasmata archaeon]|nr:hypothetical protein [Thermoplasmata archaeon]
VTVQDGANVSRVLHAVVEVAPALTVTVTGPRSLTSGDSGTWVATVSGGTAPYRLSWSLPDGENGTGSAATFSPSSAGTDPLQFQVKDAANGSASTTFNVSVSSSSTVLGGSIDGVPTLVLVGGVAVIVIAAAAVGLVVCRRRRTRDDSG